MPIMVSVVPSTCVKTVHFIRHGEAFHNQAARKFGHDAYKSYDYEDARLTELGWLQGKKLNEHLCKLNRKLELVVTSPLNRTLETTAAIFSAGEALSGGDSPLLMREQAEEPGRRCAHTAIRAPTALPIVAHELLRERIGVHPCDKMGPLSVALASFPAVDFSLCESETDALWQADVREAEDALSTRGQAFLQWLSKRPEREVAVVTHSSWLDITLKSLVTPTTTEGQKVLLTRWFENMEMRTFTMVLEEPSDGQVHDHLHFPGYNPDN